IGSRQIVRVAADDQGRMKPDALAAAFAGDLVRLKPDTTGAAVAQGFSPAKTPTIICAQAGNVNSGAFDPLDAIADVAGSHSAWLHVDGAFGLWAAASDTLKHHTRG